MQDISKAFAQYGSSYFSSVLLGVFVHVRTLEQQQQNRARRVQERKLQIILPLGSLSEDHTSCVPQSAESGGQLTTG